MLTRSYRHTSAHTLCVSCQTCHSSRRRSTVMSPVPGTFQSWACLYTQRWMRVNRWCEWAPEFGAIYKTQTLHDTKLKTVTWPHTFSQSPYRKKYQLYSKNNTPFNTFLFSAILPAYLDGLIRPGDEGDEQREHHVNEQSDKCVQVHLEIKDIYIENLRQFENLVNIRNCI